MINSREFVDYLKKKRLIDYWIILKEHYAMYGYWSEEKKLQKEKDVNLKKIIIRIKYLLNSTRIKSFCVWYPLTYPYW